MKWLQLYVVLWKNFVIRKRHWFLTLVESLLPILLFFLVAYGRSKITNLKKTEVREPTFNTPLLINYGEGINIAETHILYTPNTEFYNDIIRRIQLKMDMYNNNNHGFNTEKQLMDYYVASSNHTIIAITFKGDEKNFDYAIRYHEPHFSWETNNLYYGQYSFLPGMGTSYNWRGFLVFQKALDFAFIEKVLDKSIEENVTLYNEEFPYPPYNHASGVNALFSESLPLITLFSFIFLCPAVLKRVVEEKYSGIKELMKMVGMEPWMQWLGWFIYGMTPMLISITVIVMLMKIPFFDTPYPPIEFASGAVLFVFFLLYCMAAIVFCFFISTLFSKPNVAMIAGLLTWILSYSIPKYLLDSYMKMTYSANILLLLFPNMALHFGYNIIASYEEREIGISWSNFYLSASGGGDDVTMLNVLIMLIFDIFFYSILTTYFDNVNPGKYGIRKSAFYPILYVKKFICRICNNVEPHYPSEVSHLENIESACGLNKGISLNHVYKRFGTKDVVKDLNLDIYEGRITVLLGHNGAGKTTTMGMITGMLNTSSGSIRICDKDIKRHTSAVRSQLGLCPQHNLLFPDLTVAEHLEFFAKLKGKTSLEASVEVDFLLDKLGLSQKRNAMAHTLSGGMKRKLCLGMAIIGDSKILILDEPTSGMDVESRRALWDLLLSYRNKKTILITTHFMEEADALGDWIAIMADGSLKCYGTPMFLKKMYDTGYHLSLILRPEISSEEARRQQRNIVEQAIKKYIPGVTCKSMNGNNVVYLLPLQSSSMFSAMLKHLEDNKDDLKIDNISIAITTLEDVFLKSNLESGKDTDETDSTASETNSFLSTKSCCDAKLRLKGGALFIKRWNFLKKKYLSYLLPCLVALAFFILSIFLNDANVKFSGDNPELKLKLTSYGSTGYAYYNGSDTPMMTKLKEIYKQQVAAENGQPSDVPDVTLAIIKEGIDNIKYYKKHMIVGAEFNTNYGHHVEAIAFYNAIAAHSSPISLNLITNALTKYYLGEEYSISASNWPLPNINGNAPAEMSEVKVVLLWLIMVPIGCLFVLGTFIFFPHTEISTNFTQIQFMCGVKPVFYWLVNYLADMLMYLILAFILMILMAFWQPFEGVNEFGTLFGILFMYGLCGIPYTYLFSRKNTASGAFALFVILGILSGIVLTLIIGILIESGDAFYINIGENLNIVAGIFCPQYALSFTSVRFASKAIENYNMKVMDPLKWSSICYSKPNPCCESRNSDSCAAFKSYLPQIRTNLICMAAGALIFFLINVGLHSYTYKKICNTCLQFYYRLFSCNRDKKNHNVDEEIGVVPYNRQDSQDSNQKFGTLRANKLKKKYKGDLVVNGIEFEVNKGECLGILGVNGAGKTTTFKMLTREAVIDDGWVSADNDFIHQDSYLEKLGYCPQEDSLNFALTGRQILDLMISLRGCEQKRHEFVEDFLELFELREYADIPCGQYSGGNKRKLSLAVAMIGFPSYVLLDEPTNGVDPFSRRKFWTLIKKAQNVQNTSFILTSHSMAECEALCNILKIMKNGRICRDGTIANLKKEVNGYTLKLKINMNSATNAAKLVQPEGCDVVDGAQPLHIETIDDVKKFLLDHYNGELKDEHSGLLHYYIDNKENQRLSDLFRDIEELKQNYSIIEDYTLCEASLEDVFLSVARSPG